MVIVPPDIHMDEFALNREEPLRCAVKEPDDRSLGRFAIQTI